MSESVDYEAKLTEMMKEAMKGGDKQRLMALRALKSALTNERTKTGKPLDEKQSIAVFSSYRKKMSGALEQYEEAGRDELAAQAKFEIALCDELLPAQLSEADVEKAVDEQIEAAGATSMADLGKVIGPLMKKFAGQVDGNVVRQIVSKKLGD